MNEIKNFNIDLSRQYNPYLEKEKEYFEIQSDLMLLTMSIFNRWDKCYKYDTEEILYLFKQIRNKFGEHPYHYILDGRIASIVNRAVRYYIKVPPEFMDDYYFFEFKPWNNPNLKYSTLEQLMIQYPDAVPPEFKH